MGQMVFLEKGGVGSIKETYLMGLCNDLGMFQFPWKVKCSVSFAMAQRKKH